MTRFNVIENFAENLEIERVKLGLSQREMASKLEISLSSYKRLIDSVTTKVDLYTAYKLYLLTGKNLTEFMGVTDNNIAIKNKLSELNPQQVSFIESVVDFERDFKSKHDGTENFLSVYVPTGNMEDGMIYDSVNIEKVDISEYRAKYGDKISCGILITSNHLHPVYNLGDILMISRRPIRDGDTGVFINKNSGCAYIRKFYQTSPCRLEPINGYGETFYVDSQNKSDMDNWIKFGVVIAKMR